MLSFDAPLQAVYLQSSDTGSGFKIALEGADGRGEKRFFIHRSFKAINVSAAPAQVKTNSGVLFSVLFGPGVCI